MSEFESPNLFSRYPAASLILIIILVAFGFVMGGVFCAYAIAPLYSDESADKFVMALSVTKDPALKPALYAVQAASTFVGLIIAPLVFFALSDRRFSRLFANQLITWKSVIVTAILVVVFMGVNSIVIQWNAEMQFPDFAKDFEAWARDKEDVAAELTKFLTTFDSPTQVLIAILVIAVLPAFGEEIVFRGIIQNLLLRITTNPHVAIWCAAALFSAMHMQFFGFLPRMLLGALFGYLYYWSGSLMLAVLAHFVNNGLSVVALYFYQRGDVTFDVEDPKALPLSAVIFSVATCSLLLYYFYTQYQSRTFKNPL